MPCKLQLNVTRVSVSLNNSYYKYWSLEQSESLTCAILCVCVHMRYASVYMKVHGQLRAALRPWYLGALAAAFMRRLIAAQCTQLGYITNNNTFLLLFHYLISQKECHPQGDPLIRFV